MSYSKSITSRNRSSLAPSPTEHGTPPQQGQGQKHESAQEVRKKKTARPPSNVCNILLRRKMVGLIVSTVMHYMQQLVLSMEHLT